MDTFKIKHLIEEMMKDTGMSLLQAEIKVNDIVSVACDLIREEYEEQHGKIAVE